MDNCVFCKIVKGEISCYKVWENSEYIAFLSLYPEIEGHTIVIPKKHYDSYIFDTTDKVIYELMDACKIVAKVLDKNLDNISKTCLLFEGFEVNHLHAKLYPIPNDLKHMPKLGSAHKATQEELEDVAKKIGHIA